MGIAILIFLTINAVFLGFIVYCFGLELFENSTAKVKRCGVLEDKNKTLASQCEYFRNKLEDVKNKMPLRSRYEPGAKVICVINDRVVKGSVRAVVLFENERVDYQVETLNKEGQPSEVINVRERDVYKEDTINLTSGVSHGTGL